MDLDRFWTAGKVAGEDERQAYLSWVMHECLAGGDFYAREGIEAATIAIEKKLKTALAERKSTAEITRIVPVNLNAVKASAEKRAAT